MPKTRRTKSPQKARDSRAITVHAPFNYYWPTRAVTHFHTPGEYTVKNCIADFAVQKGYASEGKLKDSDAATADTGPAENMGDEDVPEADRAAGRWPVDGAAG